MANRSLPVSLPVVALSTVGCATCAANTHRLHRPGDFLVWHERLGVMKNGQDLARLLATHPLVRK